MTNNCGPLIIIGPDPKPKLKWCSFLAPVGEAGSEMRQRADYLRDFLLTPALKACRYATPPDRADRILSTYKQRQKPFANESPSKTPARFCLPEQTPDCLL